MVLDRTLPAVLRRMQLEIEGHARSYGLDFFDVIFELVSHEELNAVAAYGGFPNRYPHWRFGMEFEQLSKGYQYGLSKIYELVINNDPCYAYLMDSNALVDQKLVMAHVYGHCDFFKNNAWFGHTSRKMMDILANHGARIRRYMDRYGTDTVEDLIGFGSMTQQMAAFLAACVKIKLNVLVSGGSGAGKTTLLNVLSSFIPEGERVVTVEDAAELKLHQPHVVRLESRPPNIEGKGEVKIRDLVRNCLRMRPDRIVVGEVRGGEALDMLQAMNTGHEGSLSTIHANTPRDAVARIETMAMMAGMELPSRAIREQIAAAIHLIVQIGRLSDGSRKVVSVTEIQGMEGNVVVMQDIFAFQQKGIGEGGKVQGVMQPTGMVPRFMDRFAAAGIHMPNEIFRRPTT